MPVAFAAVGKNSQWSRRAWRRWHDNALAAEHLRCLADEIRTVDRAGIDRNFVRPGLEQSADIVSFVDPAADGERHEYLFCRPRDHVENDAAILVRRRDVEKTKLIRAFAVVNTRDLHRIAGVL